MEKEKFTIYSAGAGSGKTYTLAQQILKVLWEQDRANYFQHVLAITFTNKAANEMKERLLKYLYQAAFYQKQPDHTKQEIDQFVSSLGYSIDDIQEKSLLVFRSILHSYSRLSVSTIDKFNLGLIKSFSKELGVSQSFDVELDSNQVLKEALEVLIATAENPSPLWSQLYRETMRAVLEGKTWNLKSKYFKELKFKFNDQHAVYLEFFELLDQDELIALEHQIQEYHTAADVDFKCQIQLFLETCNSNGLTNTDFAGKSLGALRVVEKWALGGSPKFITAYKSYLKKSFVHPKCKNPFPHEVEEKLLTNFGRLIELVRQKSKLDEIRSNLGSMLVWSTLRKKINDILAPEGKMLISDFNKIISNSIVLQTAPYIYEKIGVNYKHYFIDEFQDTSALQWSNFLPLLQEAHANGDTAMLVGDVKQAIYSFRGGDSSLMLNVLDGKESVAFKTKELQNNYRSFSNIVVFNNTFYMHLKDYLVDASFAEKYSAQQNPIKKQNGYVEILLNPEIKGEKELQHQALCDTFIDQIQRAKSAGYAYSEMCVLTHKNDHILEISELLQQHGIRSFSSHNQKINQNPIIQSIIALMRALDSNYRDEYLWEFWHNFHVAKGSGSPYAIDFLKFKGQQKNGLANAFKLLGVEDATINWEEKELYTLVVELFDNLGFYEEGGAFVQRFIDFVFDFQESKGSDLSLFLELWEDQENGLYAASSNLDAVQIMTVHKSKGLEFPVVFLPYFIKTIKTNDEKIYIPSGLPQMPMAVVGMKAGVGKEQHPYWEETQAHKAKMEMDVINSYYVATTRASEQLYIIVAEDRAKGSFNSGVTDFAVLDEGYRLGDPQRESIPNQKDSHILPRQLSLSYTSWQGSLSIARDVHPLKNRAQSKGTLMHKAFSKLQDIKDASAVKQWLSQQPMEQSARNELISWLELLVTNESLNPFFKDCLQVYNERDFLTLNNTQLRPDRFVEFEPNQYAIIDYKTGKARDKDKVQLEGYKQQLSELGYTIKKTLLIYFSDQIEIIAV